MIAKSGIYQIRNTESGKRYIGSAKCFKVRWSRHLSVLAAGKHHSQHLQRAWDLYGKDVFEFEILLVCDHDNCLYFEQRAIDSFHPEYNINPTAASRLGAKSTEEHRRRISAAHTGKVYAASRRAQIRATLIALDTGKKYSCGEEQLSISQASKKFGISYNVLQHRIRVYGSLQAAIEHVPADHTTITKLAHAASRSKARKFEFSGEYRSISEWAAYFNVSRKFLRKKIREGMSMEQAISGFRRLRTITFQGRTKTVSEWCADTGLTESALSGRIRRGWSIKDALTIPLGVQGADVRKAYCIAEHSTGHNV